MLKEVHCTLIICSTDTALPEKCRRLLWAKDVSVDIYPNDEYSVQFIELKNIYTRKWVSPISIIKGVFKDLWRGGIELYLARFTIEGNRWEAELDDDGEYKKLYTFKLIHGKEVCKKTSKLLLQPNTKP